MKEVLIDHNGFWLRHMKTAAYTSEHNYEHAPIYSRHDALCVCFFISSASK